MGSDRARVSYDPDQQYRGVVMQQGRVFVEADWNEQLAIAGDESIAELTDIVGPCGTPDNGYAISFPNKPAHPYDIAIGKGTMYVGGVRVFLPADITYYTQPDWLDPDPDPNQPKAGAEVFTTTNEFVYLQLIEQEVSAVEDSDLLDVALGGPDTSQRLRLIQHIVRIGTQATDCSEAMEEAQRSWNQQGLYFDAKTMRLKSQATLQVISKGDTSQSNCEPAAQGGYLDADNQLLRVKVVDSGNIVWGFDDASFLYQVDVTNSTTLTLHSSPVDLSRRPRKGQAVEVLLAGSRLHNGAYVAVADGFITTLHDDSTPLDNDPQQMQVTLNDALDTTIYKTGQNLPPVFLRIWAEKAPFTPGSPTTLGDTGLQVTLTGKMVHAGDYWMFAVRPAQPTLVYPERYLSGPQPPERPRQWICPLAVIAWTDKGGQLLQDCRNPFCNLVDLTKRHLGGCCTITIRVEDLSATKTLQSIINGSLLNRGNATDEITICLMPGVYSLPAPLLLGTEHSHLTLEGCHDGVVLQAAAGAEAQFLQGLIVLNHANDVTLRRLRFELPQVSFAASGGKLTLMDSYSAAARDLSRLLPEMNISIGIRPVHCANLTVKDCLFRYSLTPGRSVFGVGIFGGSECWGLTVQGNRFVREEDYLRISGQPYRLLIGYLLAPSATGPVGHTGKDVRNAVPGNALVRPLLQDAAFRDNVFAGLTCAVLILSDCGVVRFDNNSVRECVSGFLLVSLMSLAYMEFLADALSNKQAVPNVQRLFGWMLLFLQPLLVPFLSRLLRGFPLPAQFRPGSLVRLQYEEFTANAGQAEAEVRAILEKARMIAAAYAAETTDSAAATREYEEGYAYLSCHLPNLSAFSAQVFLVRKLRKQGLSLSLHMVNNMIASWVPNGPSGIALLVWGNKEEQPGDIILSANKLRSRTTEATAVLFLGERSAITGNTITNDAAAPADSQEMAILNRLGRRGPWSLVCVANPLSMLTREQQSALATVTGNVFSGAAILPPRPTSIPAPLNTWDIFNTEV